MKIMKFLGLWLKDIVLVFIFISIVEIIIPNGNMKKYINMILGLLIILTIINPFIEIFQKDYSFNQSFYKNQIESIDFLYKDNEELKKIQEEQIKNFYMGKFEKDLEDKIVSGTNYDIEKIQTTFSEGNKDEPLLINIFLREKDVENKDRKIQIKKIKEISVEKENENVERYFELEDTEIRKNISEYYKLPEANIRIFLNNMGEGESDG